MFSKSLTIIFQKIYFLFERRYVTILKIAQIGNCMINKKIAFMVAGLTSGSGKTTVTQGLLALLTNQGYSVQSFKLGPDYIDSGHHAMLTGRPCINLDKFLLTPKGLENSSTLILKEHFYSYSEDCDTMVIEAVGGIYDDWYHDGNNPAQIAIDLDLEVILVADGFSYCQTLGIMLNSVINHNKDLKVSSVILNRISSKEHYERILETISPEYKHMFIGFLELDKHLFIPERHLGLATANESDNILSRKSKLIEIFSKFNTKYFTQKNIIINSLPKSYVMSTRGKRFRIAIAYDKAFSFYYAYNLQLLEALGAELVHFSPLKDNVLPKNISGMYIGGGFPEIHAKTLAKNKKLLEEIKIKAELNLPIYAECGGLIYLGKSTTQYISNKIYDMVGIFDIETNFKGEFVLSYFYGYLLNNCLIGQKGEIIKGHLFHRTNILEKNQIQKSSKIYSLSNSMVLEEGFTYKNVYASYAHIHFAGCQNVAFNFMKKVKGYKIRKKF